eukprot:CAMPEP_0177615660 /NCGR_PEP_ID=MMETSP0419_2-20121207/23601_1 /TAXON_ID=582737 /ORGANISM="Tetraselmis sp., Strain GSL018" /LENGTH=134 /DNA_ID=CAMNT_0019113387 /DNA_START=319 /DNA_END=722 /DNA_ORIENTATION=-
MADSASQAYTYSGATLAPDPWDPFVLKIKEEVEKHTGGFKFNSCLLNLYRDGSDHVGWHSDDETLYGKNTTIGSVSLGSARDFLLRRNADHQDKLTFKLCKGDILNNARFDAELLDALRAEKTPCEGTPDKLDF